MTQGLEIGRTRQLYELLLRQRAVETSAQPRVNFHRIRFLAAPRALVAWCLPLLRAPPATLPGSARSNHPAFVQQQLPQGVEIEELNSTLSPDCWQDLLMGRLAMLASAGDLRAGRPLSCSMLGAAVRFVGVMCR